MCDYLWLFATICNYLRHLEPSATFATIREPLWLFATMCNNLRPFTTTCDYLGYLRPVVTICYHVRPFATNCDHLRPFTTICDIWVNCDHLRTLVTICHHLRPFETTCNHLRPCATILWPCATTCDYLRLLRTFANNYDQLRPLATFRTCVTICITMSLASDLLYKDLSLFIIRLIQQFQNRPRAYMSSWWWKAVP